MATKRTFEEMDREAAAMPNLNTPVARGVNYVIAHAADNMPDEQGRIDSIVCLLSFPSEDVTPAVVRWFARRGITA